MVRSVGFNFYVVRAELNVHSTDYSVGATPAGFLWETHSECGSGVCVAFDRDAGVIEFHIALDQGEAKACALVAPNAVSFLREGVEEMWQIRRIDAAASIADFE